MSDTHARLLAQAETLVRKLGYSGFSYAALSEAVGIRKASVHYHFRTKDDLVLALVRAYDARYDVAMDAIRADHGNGVDRIEAYARLYLLGVEQGLGCLCAALAIELDALPPAIRAAVTTFFEKHILWLEAVLREGVADRSISLRIEPAHHARMIVATLEGALLMERLLEGSKGFVATLTALRSGLQP